MAADFQAQIDALVLMLKGKADLDPKTGKLRRDQTADATPDDAAAWLAAGIKVEVSAPAATPTPTPAAPANLLLPATVAALAAGVKTPGSTPQPLAMTPGKYQLVSTNAVTGYDVGVKFLRALAGPDLPGTYNKLQNGAQTIVFTVAETGTFYFVVAANNSTATLTGATLTKLAS